MINYNIYNFKQHPLTYSSGDLKNLPEDIISILEEWEVEWSDKVIVASSKDIPIIGFFRYDLGDVRPWLYAAGTYIIPEYRNKNIAFDLWCSAINFEKPNKVLAHVASTGGLNLIHKVKMKYSKIYFDYSLDKKMLVA